MSRFDRIRYGIHEFFYTLLAFPRAWRFMLHYRLWRGLRQYGWVGRGLIAIGVFISIYLVSEVADWFNQHQEDPLTALAIGNDSLLLRLLTDAYESLSDGALNWVILILLEVVIYHFMRETLRIILDKDTREAHTFKPFLNAQKRMIWISFFSFVAQEVVIGVAGAFPAPLEWTVGLAAQSLFLGYAIADNYNEQFELTKTESVRYLWRNYVGICLGLGLPLFLMLKVPVIGAFVGPLLTSVTAGIVLRERSDLHIVGYQMTEKEREKAEAVAEKKRRKEEKKARKAARRGKALA